MAIAWTAPPTGWENVGIAGGDGRRRRYGDGTVGEVMEVEPGTFLGRLTGPFSDATDIALMRPTGAQARDAVDQAHAARSSMRVTWCSATTDAGLPGPVLVMTRQDRGDADPIFRVYGRDTDDEWWSLTGGIGPTASVCWWKYVDNRRIQVGDPLAGALDRLVADLMH